MKETRRKAVSKFTISRMGGLSLVELLISITLGLVLMAGVLQMFAGSKVTFATQQGVARVQETGRQVIEFLSKDIRMAGYSGCATRRSNAIDSTLFADKSYSTNMAQAIQGYIAKGTGLGSLPADSPVKLTQSAPTDVVAVPNSDLLVLTVSSESDVVITKTNDSATLFANITNTVVGGCGGSNMISGLCDGDVVAVSDCEYTRIFQITHLSDTAGSLHINHAANGTLGNTISSWQPDKNSLESFPPGSYIQKIGRVTYFIGINPTTKRSSLYQVANGVTTELVEGVEDMRLQYGIDTNTGNSAAQIVADTYRTADQITDWNTVLSVRIQLLVQSADNVLPETRKIVFNGETKTYDKKDKKLRQVFVSTVGIRNRLL